MPFLYITGAAGTGKSAIAQALRERGYAAYDEDAPGVGSAHEIATNQPVAVPPADKRSQDWFLKHEWKILDTVLKNLMVRAKTETILVCGNSIPPADALQLFDKILYLKVTEPILRKRIAERADNDYGKSEPELRDILAELRDLDEQYNAASVTTIDATQPLETVLAEIGKVL